MATTTDIRAPRGARGAGAGLATPEQRLAAFRQARRHTWSVRTLKLVLPSAAAATLLVYGATLYVMVGAKPPQLDPGTVRIDSENLTMENPKYEGFGKDGSRYLLRAKSAATDVRMSRPIALTTIDGDLVQQNGTVTHLKATRGTYDQKKGELELYERIDIDGSNGMKARLTRATVYAKESRVVSSEPVVAELPSASVRARTMELDTKSRQASFRTAVEVQLRPAPKAQNTAAKPPSSLPGLALDSGAPVDVRADVLDVDDNAHTAIFRNNVTARQADATLTAPELQVIYEGRAALPGSGGAQDGQPSATRLKALTASGGVLMTQNSERASGDTLHYQVEGERAVLRGNVVLSSGTDRRATSAAAEFDRTADTALLTGDVIVSQGQNLLKGQRLWVDRKAAKTRLDSPAAEGQPAGRISATFYRTEQQATAETEAKEGGGWSASAESATGIMPLGAAFKTDPKAPIEVEADSLDIFDQTRSAVFKGTVIAKQGEFVVRAAELTARYSGQSGLGLSQTPGAPRQGAQLTRIEARQKVVITSTDGRTASGDWADFDVKRNTAVVGGKVIVSQGQSVVEGRKLLIDLSTGQSRFEMDPGQPGATAAAPSSSTCPQGQVCSKGRIRAVFYPKEVEAAKKKGAEAAAGALKSQIGKQPSTSSWESTTSPRGDR